MILREYQKLSVDACVAAAKRGRTSACICLPTGAGKTAVMAELCRIAKRPLVISPSLQLMRQLAGKLHEWLDESVAIEQGMLRARGIMGTKNRMVVASKDTLLSRDRYKSDWLQGTSLVIVDECHIGITEKFEGVLSHYQRGGAFVVGLSATPYKGRGKPLRFWGPPDYAYSLLDAINDGWLVRPRAHLSQSKAIDLSLVTKYASDWHQGELEAVLTAEHAVQEVASLVMQTYQRRPSAVYCQSIAQAKLLAEVFDRRGVKASLVYSDQLQCERKANLDAFASGATKIICNVNVLSYGWDHPELRVIYNAAPTQSLAVYEQRIGRGTRPLAGVVGPELTAKERLAAIASSAKPEFHVYDITDSSRSMQLVNAIDLLDRKSRDSEERRARGMRAMESDDGVDVVDESLRLDEWEIQRLQEESEARKERRRCVIVGMTWEHEHRDLFANPQKPQKKERGWRMLYGKYRGQLIRELPTEYLEYQTRQKQFMYAKTAKAIGLRDAVRRELERRRESLVT